MASVASPILPTTSTSTSTSTSKSTPTMTSTSTSTSTPRDFLASTTLLDVMQTVKPGPSHRVISVHEDDPVYSALRLMDTHNISSVCVTRHGTHQGVAPEGVPVNAEHPIIGMMQLYDVLVPLILHTVWTEVHHYHRELENRKMAEDPKDREKLHQVIQVAIEKDVFQKPVRACVGFSDETSQLYMMACNTKLSDVLSTFGTSGIHRALLIHNHQDRHNEYQQLRPEIISQIDLIAYIYQQHQRLGSIMSESLTSLGLADPKKKMITVTEKETAWDAFMALNDDSLFPMRDHLNAVPIVASTSHKVTLTDQDADIDGVTLPAGRLLGSLSVSDIRGLHSTNVHTLMLPVLDYLKLHYPTRQSSIFQITASPTTTFLQLFQLILDNLVHRVWIVDSQNKPIGVVTLSDMIDVFQKRVAGVEAK